MRTILDTVETVGPICGTMIKGQDLLYLFYFSIETTYADAHDPRGGKSRRARGDSVESDYVRKTGVCVIRDGKCHKKWKTDEVALIEAQQKRGWKLASPEDVRHLPLEVLKSTAQAFPNFEKQTNNKVLVLDDYEGMLEMGNIYDLTEKEEDGYALKIKVERNGAVATVDLRSKTQENYLLLEGT